MVTSPPRPPPVVAPDPLVTGSVTAAPGAMKPESPQADGFVVEWQLAGGADREW